MINKLQKLRELNELLQSGAISESEFEQLKKDVLNGNDNIDISNKTESNKPRIILESFTDINGSLISPPNIEFLDIDSISKEEINLFKPFIKQKQIYNPSLMTEDELKLSKKLFSIQEIAEFHSEREGYNFGFLSIASMLGAIFTLFLITMSPCLAVFGGLTFFLESIFTALIVLSKANATKLDKTTCTIAIVIDAVSLIIFMNNDF
jgi:hypothetical protein